VRDLRDLVVHLRLHFQLLLAPVFLWGWLLAGGGLTVGVVVGFVAFHLFLYSGATAFNSYYDRDVGPVGGLAQPPPVSPGLLPVALAMQAVGWVLAATVNWTLWWLYGAFVALSFAYSSPRIRLKARPLASVLVVGLGQGALAFLAAWAARRGDLASAASVDGVLGALASVLLILALYPLTQLYQIEEDAARGDRTLAVAWGARRCFAFALTCTVVGGLVLVAVVGVRFGLLDAVLVGCGLVVQVVALARWAPRFNAAAILANYRQVMRVSMLSALGLGGYLLLRLISGGG
jgi:4-hydroxybenzoate polyprenyltransferase